MQPKELDVVRMKDGRSGTILEIFNDGEAYMIEISDDFGRTIDTPIVQKAEIENITYSA